VYTGRAKDPSDLLADRACGGCRPQVQRNTICPSRRG
jgi:hypothetical protein